MNLSLAARTTPADDRWRRSLAAAIRDPAVLIERLSLGAEWIAPAERAARLFPLLVPESYLARMEPGNARDPLLRQVLPLEAEIADTPGFVADALEESAARRAPGLLQKYAGRALLITTGTCAVHCRYCFRRHYPYGDEPRQMDDWEPAFTALAADESIREVLLSGGDPLVLNDRRLAELCVRLEAIPHLRRLRVHTRLPIVVPERITPAFVDLLRSTRLTPVVVIHANHARELRADCAAAVRRLVCSGLTVLNQSVLLAGVNDTADAQAELCERLIDLGVVPYYLHQLDRVAGTAHFEVAEETGRRVIAELRRRLPGYAVPQYVREEPGAAHKVPLA
jgi:EF-P beta-lysylation protein EpmB